MLLEGTVNIKASRDKVFAFLTDPNKVSQCAPGVEKVEVLEGGKKFRATAAIGFGTVKAKFTGDAEFVELESPARAKIKAHGNAPGSAADVMSEMILTEVADGSTDMKWSADVVILGSLASLAARMMKPVTQSLTGQFFDCVKKKIEG